MVVINWLDLSYLSVIAIESARGVVLEMRIRSKIFRLVVAFLLVATWVATAVVIRQDEAVTTEGVTKSVSIYSNGLQQEIVVKIRQMDFLTRSVKSIYERSADHFDLLRDIPSSMTSSDSAFQITVIDKTGVVAQSTRGNAKGVSLADREHFLVHRERRDVGLYISRPIVGRVSHAWSLQFARRLEYSDGLFAGVVVVSVNPEFLSRGLYSSAILGNRGSIALVCDQGQLLSFSSPLVSSSAVGTPYTLERLLAGSKGRGVIRDVDGHKEFIVSTPITGYPMHVVVTRDVDEALVSHRDYRAAMLVSATVITLLLLACLWIEYQKSLVLLKADEASRVAAETDVLTQLPNRRKAVSVIDDALRDHRSVGRFAILYFDFDDFERINNRFGHDTGDDAIKLLSTRLRHCLPEGALLARIGGDEFLVTLQGDSVAETAAKTAQRMTDSLSKPLSLRGESYFLTASIGIAIHCEADARHEQLLARADAAMYSAKTANLQGSEVRYQFYTRDVDNSRLGAIELHEELLRALARNELFVAYQPIVDLGTRKPVSCEALVRWRHPRRGLVSPDDFIPAAERTGLILDITDIVLLQVCQSLAATGGQATSVPISVNLSPVCLATGRVPQSVARYLEKFDISPDRLTFELTETAMLEQSAQVKAQLNELRRMGVKVVLDDFGMGFSSLSHLWQFDVCGIKIDRSYTAGLPGDVRVCAIVKSMIRTAWELGLSITVEGVETELQASWLSQFPHVLAQGYLFGRAEPVTV
ncbi:putative bifunctional diguanylate cyclase/phosphodiesterase [Burkholderia cepacia]|uniref:putative bifunctional diguanylate cyclase/phosphodiesterase n=1 Tax=Burkholderia cepacia TaxID=292 RepID=UPI00398ECC69